MSDRPAFGAYVVVFVGFGFLFISLVPQLHWLGFVAAAVSEFLAVMMSIAAPRNWPRARTLRHDQR